MITFCIVMLAFSVMCMAAIFFGMLIESPDEFDEIENEAQVEANAHLFDDVISSEERLK